MRAAATMAVVWVVERRVAVVKVAAKAEANVAGGMAVVAAKGAAATVAAAREGASQEVV